jgi:chromosome segregation ATPase
VALQEVRRVSEDLLVEKQAVRRQIVETQQLITNWDESLHEQDSRIERVEKLHEQLNLIADTLPPQISELRELITTTAAEIKRVELAANDWFMMSQERAEEIRQQWNQRLEELQDVDVQHLSQVTAWLERLDSWVRELEQRIGRHVTHLETADHAHRERLTELERRELHVIRELSEAVQKQFTFVHAAHVEQRNQD